ncbi:hypothetical protein NR800_36100 [Corallococcus interemptor]|uniref:SHOCT-like domain-containing protein n=1 Tax=Corallococcus TaxID=83461 RepID=UPI001CBBA03F|nr:hypothetical protein [Corallococcus sp. AS-1-6]MBZ4376922.1 hypothetical protein [Corallococcus sp. AS-1-6]
MMDPEATPSSDASSSSREGTQRHAIPWGQHAELVLHAPAATLVVSPLPEGEKPYLVTHGRVEARIQEHGRVTKVELVPREAGFLSLFWRHGGQAELFVPPDVRAKLLLDAGAVRISGLKDCELELNTDAGTASLRDVHGKLTLRTGAGRIIGERVGGTLHVHAAAGAVKLDVDALDVGEHRIGTQVGAVELRLVPGLDVNISAHTSLGSAQTRYPSNPQAATTLLMETELGSVRLRESGRSRGEDAEAWEEDSLRWQRQAERWQRRAERHANQWAHAWANSWGAPPWAGPGARHHHRPQPPAPPPPPRSQGIPDEEMRRVLDLVEAGKLSAEDAHKLLKAMQR